MINIMVVEDHLLVRDSIVSALADEPNFQVVASTGNVAQALHYLKQMRIDIALMNISPTNNPNSMEVVRSIKADYPETKVIIMTALPSVTLIEDARSLDIEGFVYKDISLIELVQTIHNCCNGYSTYPIPKDLEFAEIYQRFTQQEKVILCLMCDGLNRKEISQKLLITENTLKSHIANIKNKSGFPSISKLVLHIISQGYISPGSHLASME